MKIPFVSGRAPAGAAMVTGWTPKTEVGEPARPRALLDASRVQPLCTRTLAERSELFRAIEVFREGAENGTRGACAPHSNRPRRRGMALVITLIMLAVTLVMAVAFLALAKRERGSVSNSTDLTTARLAADAALAQAEGQMVANILNGSSNAFGAQFFVSTNFINPNGFYAGINSVTNVNYQYANGNPLNTADFLQNVANLWILPRVPVYVPTNQPASGYDFRYYLDLNENGRHEANGWQTVLSGNPSYPYYDTNGNPVNSFSPPNVLSNFMVGDPEWVGVLQRPDLPHSANNQFVSRYAFAAVPIGNALDVNYIHNEVQNQSLSTSLGFMRNQGVGAWEINLAAFLADLNTNIWGQAVGSWLSAQPNASQYYLYSEPNLFANQGVAFQDALAVLKYRYNGLALPTAWNVLGNAPTVFPFPSDGLDGYGDGPLQTSLDTNADLGITAADGDYSGKTKSWPGADNPNHFYSLGDFFDGSKLGNGANSFVGRLASTGTSNGTYNAYTFYRMLNQLGMDSLPEDGKLNLNYSNAVVQYDVNGVVTNMGVVIGAETNLVKWMPLNFFHVAANQMLQLYTANWRTAHFRAYTNTFVVTQPFGVTNIPVLVSNRYFVYTPAVNRVLQLAANLYDAGTTNFYPSVFRPIFERDIDNNVYIAGYLPVTNVVNSADSQLVAPIDPAQLNDFSQVPSTSPGAPLKDTHGYFINVYGVPWIVGAKKGLPAFNQMSLVNSAEFDRLLEITRPSVGGVLTTNQMVLLTVNNNMGVSFWNSYSDDYVGTGNILVYVNHKVELVLTNSDWGATVYSTSFPNNFYWSTNRWAGSRWGAGGSGNPAPASFLVNNWTNNFIVQRAYDFVNRKFTDTNSVLAWDATLSPLPQMGLITTNWLQAYILDGNHLIDYVQLYGPRDGANLNAMLKDPDYSDSTGYNYLWSTNVFGSGTVPSWGIINQINISSKTSDAPPPSARWNKNAQISVNGLDPVTAAIDFFGALFKPSSSFTYVNSKGKPVTVLNQEPACQAPYTAARMMYVPYLYQVNDPLVHYLASDLNAGNGATWSGGTAHNNGLWVQNDKMVLPTPPGAYDLSAGRYQPWGKAAPTALQTKDYNFDNTYNLIYKDPLVWCPDYWNFPTNQYPSVGWMGRVHRGTPWQTVYFKARNVLHDNLTAQQPFRGTNTWAAWVGDVNLVDAANCGPLQDRLLFDVFTTRMNDNAACGTLPVNVGAGGQLDGGLAAWSALFGGMVVLTNTTTSPASYVQPTNDWMIVSPAGPNGLNSALGYIVTNINFYRSFFTNEAGAVGSFEHAGDVLSVPALTEQSPFLNRSSDQVTAGINDQVYEWLPQQMMGLVRAGQPRYVLYCYGQALRPAPGTSGLITNYQVVAESAIRAVLRVDNATTGQPKVVVENATVLPSY